MFKLVARFTVLLACLWTSFAWASFCEVLDVYQTTKGSEVDEFTPLVARAIQGSADATKVLGELTRHAATASDGPFEYPEPLGELMLARFLGLDSSRAQAINSATDPRVFRDEIFARELNKNGEYKIIHYVLRAIADFRLTRRLGAESYVPVRNPARILELVKEMSAKRAWSLVDQNRLIVELAIHLPKTSTERKLLLDRLLGLNQNDKYLSNRDIKVEFNGEIHWVPDSALDAATALLRGIIRIVDFGAPAESRVRFDFNGRHQSILAIFERLAEIETMPDFTPAQPGTIPLVNQTQREAVLSAIGSDPELKSPKTLDLILGFLVPLFPPQPQERMQAVRDRWGDSIEKFAGQKVWVNNPNTACFLRELVSQYRGKFPGGVANLVKELK